MHAAEIQNRPSDRSVRCSPLRQLIQGSVLVLIFLLLFRTFGAEPYQVPTGSMWPALAGNHRAIDCPRCGYRVVVGRHRPEAGTERENQHYYRVAVCPNCGCAELGLDRVPECPGDHLLVNKSVFELRQPRRWEMAVFRCPAEPGKAFVKRVVGLPGEQVQVRGGDIYIDGRLARKTLSEFKAVRIPVFDNDCQPAPNGFRNRWESQPGNTGVCALGGTCLYLNAEQTPQAFQCLVYRHAPLDSGQSRAIHDEYVYNGCDPHATMPVHDFMLECNLKVVQGSGSVLLGITDGQDRLIVELPAGSGLARKPEEMARLRQEETPFRLEPPSARKASRVFRQVPDLRLVVGKTYHVELAFVDRRLTLAIDGTYPFPPIDFPAVATRSPVVRPFKVGARGVNAVVQNVRLFRDIYYTEAGTNGTRQVVSLEAGEYFVLGDNSPNSDDSRFWPNRGVVPLENFIGKPFLAHLPSRVVQWPGWGKPWERIGPDWGRIRWLR